LKKVLKQAVVVHDIAFQKALFPYQHIMNIITGYNSLFEVHVISYCIIDTPHVHIGGLHSQHIIYR